MIVTMAGPGSRLYVDGGEPPSGNSYSTDFALTENPMSEGGRWVQGLATGIDWQNCRTSGGRCYAAAHVSDAEGVLDDATCHLTGTWAANQQAKATVYNTPGYPSEGGGANHEMELHLRCTITANSIYTYECTVSSTGPFIVRWNGGGHSITYLSEVNLGFVPLETGQILRATVIGDVISLYQTPVGGGPEVLICQATDSSGSKLTSGAPGLAFFPRSGATLDARAFTHFEATDL